MRTGQAVLAEGVVHMHDADALNSQQRKVGDGFLHLALVGRADVEDIAGNGLVQRHGARGGPHQRHAVLVQQRNDALGVGRAARHEQCQHALVLDERAGVVLRQLGVELVVERDEFDLLPVHAAAGVDVVQVQRRAQHRFLDGCRRGPGDADGLTHEQLRVGQ